jgi:4-hydroxythreonine-4-phosphate dehydrogenase
MTRIIAITSGDMNGIGPEVALKAVRGYRGEVVPLLVGPPEVFAFYARRYALRLKMEVLQEGDHPRTAARSAWHNGRVPVMNLPNRRMDAPVQPGVPAPLAGDFAARSIIRAVDLILKGHADALVTSPVSKSALHQAGYRWPGQTEMIQHLSHGEHVAMMLVSPSMKVGLVTIHLPLRMVAQTITEQLIIERVTTIHEALRNDWRIGRPKLALLGLNPHAGEAGDLGEEESLLLIPAIRALRGKRMRVEGPFPADGFFARYVPGAYDAIVAMYHDQGLIPLKLLAKGSGVNVSVGLPVVRTSPDHGTAFDIAGKGIADPRSMVEAFLLAALIVKNRKRKRA